MCNEWVGPANTVIRRMFGTALGSDEHDDRTTAELALSIVRIMPESLEMLHAFPQPPEAMKLLIWQKEQTLQLAKDYLLDMWALEVNLPSSDELAELANSRHAAVREFVIVAAQYVSTNEG